MTPEIQGFSDARARDEKETEYSYQRRVGTQLVEMLNFLGQIYISGDQVYFFEKEEKILYFVNRIACFDDFEQYLLRKYNFSTKQRHGRAIYDQMFVGLKTKAKPADLHSFSAYKNGVLYIRVSNSRMAVIDGQKVYYKDNSYRGVIFKSSTWIEDLPEAKVGEEADFIENFFQQIWLDDQQHMPLNTQRFLFLGWFLYLIFRSDTTSRPLLVLEGEQGTGKTSSLLAFGMLLFGGKFTAGEVPTDMRDFHNSLLNNEFVIIDNFDESAPDQFIDQLTRLTTGGGINRRPLYADINAPSIREEVQCSIAITTRTAKFNRDDLTARSIPLHLTNMRDQLDMNIDLHKYVLQNREQIWGGLLALLSRVTSHLKKEPVAFKSQFRMIEFESFCYNAFSTLGVERVHRHFENLSNAQREFAMLGNKFVQAVKEAVLEGEIGGDGNFYSTETLHEILKGFGSGTRDVQHTGNSMSSFLSLIKQFVGVEATRGYEQGSRRRGWKFYRLDI